jgi:F420-dependent oxidoreductase-like protein
MRMSVALGNYSWPGGPEAIGRRVGWLARAADQAGFDSLWTMDHLFQIPIHGPAEDPLLEAYATLAFIGGLTERIRLGVMVTAVSYRHPGMLIKSLTALDVLSGGRTWLGIGAAWHDAEARAWGLPFPTTSERFERLEETLRLAHQVWAGDASPFEGKHYRLEHPLNSPNAVQRPHPPILIGGSGERKTLRLVAQYADACNLFDIPEGVRIGPIVGGREELKRKLAVLREHCEAVGRPYDQIEKTIASTIAISRTGGRETKSPAEAVEHLGGLAELGLEHVMLSPAGPWDEESLELFALIRPDVEKLG